MIQYFVIYNLQGKIRLLKCYIDKKCTPLSLLMIDFEDEESHNFLKNIFQLVNNKVDNSSNFFSINHLMKGSKVIYR